MVRYGRKRRIKLSLLITIITIVLCLIFFRSISKGIKTLVDPFWRGKITTDEARERMMTSKKAYQEKNKELEQALAEARLRAISYSSLEEENESLKEELGRSTTTNTILAGIITTPNQSLYNTFAIDAGTEEGVFIGAKVFIADSALVGTVTDITSHNATVTALSSPGNQTGAIVSGTDITVTVTGRGQGDFEVQFPRDIDFQEGMLVVSQGVHAKTIAVIEKIISDPRDPFQRLLARMPVNIREVRFVKVEIN